jgi:hypothetical protein
MIKRLIFGCIVPVSLLCGACASSGRDFSAENEAILPVSPEIPAREPVDSPEFDVPEPEEGPPVPEFGEIWAYILQDREDALREGLPISDLGYFGAEVDTYGKLVAVPDPRAIPRFNGRIHLVVKCDSYSLTHFVLKYNSPERRELIADLLAATRNFDGLQIDFENIPPRDREQFFSFLGELRAGLKDKFFTVALRARIRPVNNDVHDYARIGPLVDRILVMAYDEHWATSAPGPIASMEWCRDVASYAYSVIGREKLIMGLPFYGRVWIEPNPAKAYIYSQIESLLDENDIRETQRERGIPNFEYETSVTAKGYYEDSGSLAIRLRMYRDMGVQSVGFWRLGQEDPRVWDVLRLSRR